MKLKQMGHMRRLTKTVPSAAEKMFVVLALIYFLNAVLLVLRNPDDLNLDAQASDLPILMLQTAVYLLALRFIAPVLGRIWRSAVTNPILVSLLVLIVASSLWSEAPFSHSGVGSSLSPRQSSAFILGLGTTWVIKFASSLMHFRFAQF